MTTSLAVNVAAASVLAMIVTSLGQDAWTQVTKSVRSKRWVRLALQLPRDEPIPAGIQPPEAWYSARQQVAARRFQKAAQYVNFARQETFEYDPAKNTVFHSSTAEKENVEFAQFDTLLRLVSEGDLGIKLPESPVEIVERIRHTVRDGERDWIEFTFRCRDPRRIPPDYTLTFRVDPRSKLPVEMRSTEKFGVNDPADERTYVIDYPDEGPDEIYALGVPRGATVVDRRRAKRQDAKELSDFLAAYEKARWKPIEACSTVVLVTDSKPVITWVLRAYRQRREGDNPQVEQADQVQLMALNQRNQPKSKKVPDELRARWWKEQVGQLPFTPFPRGDEMLPHRIGYPDLGLGPAPLDNPEIELSLDRHPKSGPDGTVLLGIRIKTQLGANNIRCWIDPEHDYMARRAEFHFSFEPQPWNNSTMIIDKLEKSPGGRWYATQARQGRVEKSGDDLSADLVRPDFTKNTQNDIGRVTTSVFRYSVEFDE